MSDISKLHCPDCGAPMRLDAFNRNGWYYAECDRRYSPKLGEWSPAPVTPCLKRQRDVLHTRLEEAKELEALWREWFKDDGDPWESDDYGRVDCFFCGREQPNHLEDCVYERAFRLIGNKEDTNARSQTT